MECAFAFNAGFAILLAIYAGLRATLLLGGGLYVCALVVILATKRTQRDGLT